MAISKLTRGNIWPYIAVRRRRRPVRRATAATASTTGGTMTFSSMTKTLMMSAAFALAAFSAHAEGIGASLLTQQHPFYNELAKAITAEAEARKVPVEISIANQDLN